jgi:hypothetical protein
MSTWRGAGPLGLWIRSHYERRAATGGRRSGPDAARLCRGTCDATRQRGTYPPAQLIPYPSLLLAVPRGGF